MDDPVGHGRGNVVHRFNECRTVAMAATHTGNAHGRFARFHHAVQLRPVTQTVGLVLQHTQNGILARVGQVTGQMRWKRIAILARTQQAQRHQRVQQHGHSVQVAAEATGQGGSRLRTASEGFKNLQFRRGSQDRGRLITAHQSQQGFGADRGFDDGMGGSCMRMRGWAHDRNRSGGGLTAPHFSGMHRTSQGRRRMDGTGFAGRRV